MDWLMSMEQIFDPNVFWRIALKIYFNFKPKVANRVLYFGRPQEKIVKNWVGLFCVWIENLVRMTSFITFFMSEKSIPYQIVVWGYSKVKIDFSTNLLLSSNSAHFVRNWWIHWTLNHNNVRESSLNEGGVPVYLHLDTNLTKSITALSLVSH